MSRTSTTGRAGALALLLTVTIVAFAAGACSSSDSDKASAPTTTGAAGTVTTVTVDTAKFDDTIAGLTTELGKKAGDLCGLVEILDRAAAAGNPTGADQARTAARFLQAAYIAIADAAPASMKADADVVRSAAGTIAAETEAPDFDAATFLKDGPKAFSDQKFLTAMTNLSSAIKACAPTTPVAPG